MSTMTLNPGVIEPLQSAPIVHSAMTANQPVSRVIYQAQAPDIIHSAPLPQTLTDITNVYTAPPTPPVVLLPDILKMSQDLVSSGQLLGDIPVSQTPPENSVLASLQPNAVPGQAQTAVNPVKDAIQLARTPLSPDTMAGSGNWGLGADHLKQLIVGLSVVTVIVAAVSLWMTAQENQTGMFEATKLEATRVFEADALPAATQVK